MTTKPIVRCWEFESSSSRGKNYETLLYADLTTSCNCMGWTRRTAPDGSRSCKHTRLVDMHRADAECVASHDYRAMSGNSPTAGLLKPRSLKASSQSAPMSHIPEPSAPHTKPLTGSSTGGNFRGKLGRTNL